MTERAQKIAEAVAQAMYKDDRNSHHHGIELVDVGPGRATMRMKVKEHMTNSHGICHGGMIFTLADCAFAYACNAYNHVTVAQFCDISFILPGKVGDLLTAAAAERHKRGRSGIYDITVANQAGETIALFRGHSRRIEGEVVPDLKI